MIISFPPRTVLLAAMLGACASASPSAPPSVIQIEPPRTVPIAMAPSPGAMLTRSSGLALGSIGTCAWSDEGTVRCWGSGAFRYHAPTIVPGLSHVVAVAIGVYHACALLEDGTVQCWGTNDHGELGDDTTTARELAAPVPGLSGVVQIHAALYATCARKADSKVMCWGGNEDGQLGDGTRERKLVPTALPGLGEVADIQLGSSHACARLADKTVRCWGRNDNGELGDGTTTSRLSAIEVRELRAEELVVGDKHTCALLQGGAVKCWGLNRHGELGDGTTMDHPFPTDVQGLSDVVQLAPGDGMHACARTADGGVWCWGWNGDGQIGIGTTTNALTPVRVPKLRGVQRVVMGIGTTCAVLDSHRARCWGDNSHGQITGIARLETMVVREPAEVTW
ncbi:MAG: hypothetical protein HY898_01170 [Deltaproteobacteria bacterium]|nr:hypothetical protein [Deltaproteobacteria bacterium]